MVISVANQKGGVGKTTTALTLAHLIHLSGRHVGVLDLDAPSANRAAGAAAASRRAQEIGIPAYTQDNFPKRPPHFVLIDCPPDMADEAARYAVARSDLVIVPTGLSLDDLEVTREYAERAEAPARILFTRVNPLSEQALRETQAFLEARGFGVFRHYVKHYSVYLDAPRFGSVAGLATREGRRATRDYERVLQEIYERQK